MPVIEETIEKLEKCELDYSHVRYIEGQGYCGLQRFIFTVGLVYNINPDPDDVMGNMFEGRYCYENHADALEALTDWSGEEDPQDNDWIKHKGVRGEWSNDNKG